MPFYVYSFWRAKGFQTGELGRQLLTFPNKEASDLLLRSIQENVPFATPSGNIAITKVERLSATFWNVYGDNEGDPGWAMYNLIKDINRGATKHLKRMDEVRNQVFLILINDGGGRDMPIIPEFKGADNVDGGVFFIKSNSHPEEYWTVANEYIGVSTSGKSRFRITAVDEKFKGMVLLPSDKVKLSVFTGGAERPVFIDQHGHLVTYETTSRELPFGSLNGGIQADVVTAGNVSTPAVRLIQDGDSGVKLGDRWELV